MIEELLLTLMAGAVLFEICLWLMHELRKRPSLLRQLALEMHEGRWLGRRLAQAARFRLPVYSAETVAGREAEFIRDRLPIKAAVTLVILLALLALLLAAFWFVSR